MGSMPVTRLKYVKIGRAGGVEYHYVRYRDRPLIALKSEPDSPDYYREYAAAIELAKGASPASRAVDHNRLDMRVESYLRSAEVRQNTKGVQWVKRRYLEALIKGHEHQSAEMVTWEYIKRVRDAKFETVPTKNDFVRYVNAFLNELMSIGAVPFNPVPPGKKSRLKHIKTPRDVWRAEHFAAFRDYWPLGSQQRVAFELFYNTGQRCVTVVKLGSANLVRGKIVIDLSLVAKDNEPAGPTIRPMTIAAITAAGATGKYFLSGKTPDSRRSEGALSTWFSKACRQAGLPRGFTAHGIRHGVMTLLAERGFTAEQIQSLTGHATTQMIQHYTKTAKRDLMAAEAVDGLADEWGQKVENRRSEVEKSRSYTSQSGN